MNCMGTSHQFLMQQGLVDVPKYIDNDELVRHRWCHVRLSNDGFRVFLGSVPIPISGQLTRNISVVLAGLPMERKYMPVCTTAQAYNLYVYMIQQSILGGEKDDLQVNAF